nr:ankyrin repeat family protein [Tanacetum cinerariifolium]
MLKKKDESLGSTDGTADIENNSLGGTHTADLKNQETPKRRCLHDVPDAKRLKDDKVKHTTTIKLLECICEKVDRTHTSSDIGRLYSSSFCLAVENNTAEAIHVMTTYFPDALLTQNDWEEILKLTVLNHSQKVYSFLVNLRHTAKYAVVLVNDYDDDSNILHLAGRLAPIQKLNAASAAITIPGGNDSDTGKSIYETKASLIIFAISDAISLFTSTTSLLLFLSILTARYALEDFLYKLPKRLIFGLVMLFLSVTSMMIAFSAALYIMFGQEKQWILIPI